MPSFTLYGLILGLTLAITQTSAQTCNATSLCPASAPCCSEFGFCGIDTFCLGGCEPLASHTPTSCMPNPLCQSGTTSFSDLSRVQVNSTLYDGNATAYDWVVNSGHVEIVPDGMRLTLNQTNGGTRISSTRYVHYGAIDFVIETSKWKGVVTAAITMSDVKDEIDWEFPGSNVTHGQTNFWYLGIANYSETQGQVIDVGSDTSADFHTFTLDWQEDYLNWAIDGKVVRAVKKDETIDGEGNAHYPMTPSRVQLSIWPAGIEGSAQGTVDWAGGMIDWSDPDYMNAGYFWNTVKSVSIRCADDPDKTDSTTGWAYSAVNGSGIPKILDTNATTVLGAGTRIEVPIHVFKSLLLLSLLSIFGLGSLL